MPANRFRIALSFAGEKRDFVAQVAAILAQRFSEDTILYDKYHEAEFAVFDLGIRLPILYGEQSDLIVPILCPNYDTKRWSGWEWVHIYGLLTKADGHRVMPCRFEKANVDGLSPASGFIELDHKTPEETATLILERLALNEAHPKDHYTKPVTPSHPATKTTIPNNLPRIQSFFGREKELATVREALDPENRTWGALIDGPGGMGKTSLAIRAASECQSGQFQRIIFVSIKDREMEDDGPVTLGNLLIPGFLEMLNEIARELGLIDFAKNPEDQRIRLLLEALRPTQVLLILDNLESLQKSDRDHLLTFVKRLPQGCKAILTSRRRIGSGSELLVLEKLDQDAALETLAELAKHNPLLAKTSEAERIALYTQTGGKPLLLRWVAGQIGRGHCRTFSDALAFLRSCPPENDPLEFIFGDLANEFTTTETTILCALTYFSLPIEVKHIAANAGYVVERTVPTASLQDHSATTLRATTVDAETALRTLANRSLVTSDDEEKDYILVPLVAEFLRRHRPEIVKTTGDLLEKRAYALIVENGYDQYDRFSALEAAWPGIAPALPLFLSGDNSRLQTACSALNDFLNFKGRWDENLALHEKAEIRAVDVGNHSAAGWRAYSAGMMYYYRGRADAVLEAAVRAAMHWNLAGSGAREHAIAISLRGNGYQLKDDHLNAIACYQQSLELHRGCSTGYSVDVAEGLNHLACAERLSGAFGAAELHYDEARSIATSLNYTEGLASFTVNLALSAMDRNDWVSAEALAREAFPLSQELGRQELIAFNCLVLATALVRQDKGAEALQYAKRAVEIYTRLRSPESAGANQLLEECRL